MRFTLRLNEEEAETLEGIRAWYERRTGVPISRNAIVKKILFDVVREESRKELILA